MGFNRKSTMADLPSGITASPTTETKYVILDVLSRGERIIIPWLSTSTKEKVIRDGHGRIEYRIVGFANSFAIGQALRFSDLFCCTQVEGRL